MSQWAVRSRSEAAGILGIGEPACDMKKAARGGLFIVYAVDLFVENAGAQGRN
jgi:hypothetical protein